MFDPATEFAMNGGLHLFTIPFDALVQAGTDRKVAGQQSFGEGAGNIGEVRESRMAPLLAGAEKILEDFPARSRRRRRGNFELPAKLEGNK